MNGPGVLTFALKWQRGETGSGCGFVTDGRNRCSVCLQSSVYPTREVNDGVKDLADDTIAKWALEEVAKSAKCVK
jgi:hypothetical protein